MLKVGVTGGIGSGKSIVCKVFETLGVPVYYADLEAKKLINHQDDLKKKIINLLGEQAYVNGLYNVDFVKKEVFKSPDLLKSINEIVHPAVRQHTDFWAEKYKSKPYVVKEAALIDRNSGLDKIIFVKASENTRIRRTLERDPERTKAEVVGIMKNQKSVKTFEEMSDFIIDNENQLLIPQVLKIHQELLKAAIS